MLSARMLVELSRMNIRFGRTEVLGAVPSGAGAMSVSAALAGVEKLSMTAKRVARLKYQKAGRLMACDAAESSEFERALRQKCPGENFIVVAISVNSLRRIVMAVSPAKLDGERIL
jgi:hypothetical protein